MGVEIKEENFGEELNSKGFLVANFDKLLTWARTGSLWPMLTQLRSVDQLEH